MPQRIVTISVPVSVLRITGQPQARIDSSEGQMEMSRWVWHMKRTLRNRAVVVCALEKLSFIGPVMVLGGSLIMIVIALCTDCPQ